MPPRRLHVAMDDLIDALAASADDPVDFALDLVDGQVVARVSEDEDEELEEERADEHEQLPIPRLGARHAYQLMERFVEEVVDDDDVAEKLGVALGGRGAFARFRDVVGRDPQLKASWHSFRRDRLIEAAIEWLAAEGIEATYTLRPIDPPPRAAPRAPKVGLFELLLLGAPEGTSSLLTEGVPRTLRLRSPADARAAYKQVARDLCALHGEPWRNRFVDAPDFLLPRLHLRLDGAAVVLVIDVPASLRQALT